jgi:hypothetical protein
VLAQAREAARPGDRVWFVDSASEDQSASIALGLGYEVIHARRGKGRAVATALERCETRYLCLVDGDLYHWTTNIPCALRDAALSSGAHMVIANFTDGRRWVITPALYWPLVDALFPEHGRRCDPIPLSGLRVIDTTLPIGSLPGGYGLETHLNLSFAVAGRRISVTDIGAIRSPLRSYANIVEMATEVADAILGFAVASRRIDAEQRPRWDRWTSDLIEVLAQTPPPGAPDEQFLARLRSTASRPFPPLRATAAIG